MPVPVRTFAHPWRIAGAAAAGLGLSALVAVQSPVPARELHLTEWFNAAPDWMAAALWPVMQLGTVWAPLVIGSALGLWRKDWVLGGVTAATGLVAWFGAKGVKSLVARDRPLAYLPHLDVREGNGTGLGFVSGHATVAAATAVLVMVALPRKARPVVVALAAGVGVARIVYGVHLPADVVGGWGLGTLLGLAGVAVVERGRARGSGPSIAVPRQ